MKELSFDTPIENVTFEQINTHIHKRLSWAGIKTVGELARKTRDELKAIPMFGRKCMTIVEDFLEENGMWLGMKENKLVLSGDGIDWEQRRYEVARDIIASRCNCACLAYISTQEIRQSIVLADIFIKELMERGGHES